MIGGSVDEKDDYISSYNYYIYYNSIKPRDPRLPIPKWKSNQDYGFMKGAHNIEVANRIHEMDEHDNTLDIEGNDNYDYKDTNCISSMMNSMNINSEPVKQTIPELNDYPQSKFSQNTYGSQLNSYPDSYNNYGSQGRKENANFQLLESNDYYSSFDNKPNYSNNTNSFPGNVANYYMGEDLNKPNSQNYSNFNKGFSNMPNTMQNPMFTGSNVYDQYQQMLFNNMKMNPNMMMGMNPNMLNYYQIMMNQQLMSQKKPMNYKPEMKMQRDKGGHEFTSLNDFLPNVIEFCKDHSGSRLVQKRYEEGSDEDRSRIFEKIEDEILNLSKDVFGNYVIQKVLEFSNQPQKEIVIKNLKGKIHELAMHMYGCRVVQKAIEYADEVDILDYLAELTDHITKSIEDQNGNHVIQKLIEKLPKGGHSKILKAIKGKVFELSTHQYGCRVIQRIFEFSQESDKEDILKDIQTRVLDLCMNQYGNYVIQHILEKQSIDKVERIFNDIRGSIFEMSIHKFAR